MRTANTLNIGEKLQKWRTPAMATVALLAGLLAVFAVRSHVALAIAAQSPPAPVAVEWTELVVAKADLASGERISDKNMAVRRVPREYAPAEALRVEQFDDFRGRRLAHAVRAGDPLPPSVLERIESVTIAGQLAPGARALTIAVDEVNAISGLLQPGDRIDLHVSVRRTDPMASGMTQGEVTTRVLENIKVLATGRQVRAVASDSNARPFTAVTVEVKPEQAQRLIVAQRHGRLTALLRPHEDSLASPVRAMNLPQAIGLDTEHRATSRKPQVEVIEGGRGGLTINQVPGRGDVHRTEVRLDQSAASTH